MNRGLTCGRWLLVLAAYSVPAVLALAAAPLVGPESLDPSAVLSGFGPGAPVDAAIFWQHRLPRCVLAFIVGAALAASGAGLQAVLANPLAEPYVLGISGAGAVGAVAAMLLPGLMWSLGPFSSVQALALAGCLLCLAGIRRLASDRLSPATVLLAGVTINILCGAGILLLRYLARPHVLVSMDRWLMGGLSVFGWSEVLAILPLALPGLGLLLWQTPSLNHLAFGRELAMGQGVDVDRVQARVLLASGLCAAGTVALAGPIGFLGLMVPHAVRRLSGPDHRILLPGSIFLGGALLALCDTLARTVAAPAELPVGVVTALLGGPAFILLLVKTRGNLKT